MEQEDYETLVRDATRLFLTARADPGNHASQEACQEFVQRSPEHRQIFERVERVHSAAGQKPGPPLLAWVLAFAIAGLSGYLGYQPLRILALSDYRTALAPAAVGLSSGDSAFLDAHSAIADKTDGDARRIEILRGAVFFDVEARDRPFFVEYGDLSVRVVGTSFEVSALSETMLVAVSEGVVVVSSATDSWTLEAGDRLRLRDGEAERDIIELEATAPWRQDQLIADGMTFGELAAIIDRRLPGTIMIPSDRLADTVVSGGVSLEDPLNALNILAATEGARVLSLPAVGKVILPAR